MAANLWKFASDVGRRLGFGKDKDTSEAALRKELDELGLEAKGVDIKVEGDTVVLSGDALSQEDKEKIILATGNVEGVSEVKDQISVEKPAPEAKFHTVERGDTLWAIAKAHYGAGSKYMAIFEANKPMLSDPDKIYPGQVLRIPDLDASA